MPPEAGVRFDDDTTAARSVGASPSARSTFEAALIVSVYQRPAALSLVLESCVYQSSSEFEIVIADDGSGSDVRDVVAAYSRRMPDRIRHVWQENRGFRKTIIVNEAVRRTNAGYLVFIDGDCVLHHHFVRSHLHYRRPGTTLSGRRVTLDEQATRALSLDDVRTRRIETPRFWWAHCPSRDRRHGFYLPWVCTIEHASRKNYWTFGSNFSLHRADFYSINGYDEEIVGRGAEDINLSQRLKLKGIRIRTITRAALQYHLHHESGPIPHSADAYHAMANPTHWWARKGVVADRVQSGAGPAPSTVPTPR
jgi:glycosyltransferase involved in cell wall biosynthesis